MTLIYTDSEKTTLAYSVKQAFVHAADVIRALRDIPPGTSIQIYPAGTFTKQDSEKTLTLEQFGKKVNEIVRKYR